MQKSNEEIVVQLAAKLSVAVRTVLETFSREHPDDKMYAFALVAPPEGNYISCAIATEQTLDRAAQNYAARGYIAKSGDTLALLRQELRWANPDDGWYQYSFQESDSILLELDKAFDSKIIEIFDGTTEAICINALRQLDQNQTFGFGEQRENIVISFTYGQDPEDFVRFSEQLNSLRTYQRIKKELTDSYTVFTKMKTPYN